MQKQLLLFHNAVSAYFSGNQSALEATMKQFAIKVEMPMLTVAISLKQCVAGFLNPSHRD
jgi:hypothetical protein